MRITIHHQLSITPGPGVAHAVQHLLLTPQSGRGQKVENWKVEMAGIEKASRFSDAYGNIAHLVNQVRPEGDLVVTASGTVETFDRHGVLGRSPSDPVPALYRRVTELTTKPLWLEDEFGKGVGRIGLLHSLMRKVGEVHGLPEDPDADVSIASDGEPLQAETVAVTPPELVRESLPGGQGQSQSQGGGGQSQSQEAAVVDDLPPTVLDAEGHEVSEADVPERVSATVMAHEFIGAARSLGIAARFVTGYLAAEDASDVTFHAWAKAFDDGLGWVGFDPTLNVCPTERHVRLATGLDALSTAPMRSVPVGEGHRVLGITITTDAQ